MRLIYTLGTSKRSGEDFIEILHSYGIKRVIDVRSFPKSKLSHFTRENLSALLDSEGIEYIWLGKELGGFRKGGYEAYTHTEDFSLGIDRLQALATQAPSTIICAERFPWKCHRRWISRELQRRNWYVIHILEKDRTWQAGGHQPA